MILRKFVSMDQILFIFVILIHSSLTSEVAVEPCIEDGNIPIPLVFNSEGCEKPPCPFYKGSISSANITFKIPEDTDIATVDIKAKIQEMWIPFPPPDKNVCHNLLNSYCPLDKNEIVIFNIAIPVLKLYPSIGLTLKIKVLDERQEIISCMKVECKIVSPEN